MRGKPPKKIFWPRTAAEYASKPVPVMSDVVVAPVAPVAPAAAAADHVCTTSAANSIGASDVTPALLMTNMFR